MKELDNLKSFLNIPEEVEKLELGKDRIDKAKVEADNDRIKMLFDIPNYLLLKNYFLYSINHFLKMYNIYL